MRTVVTGAGGFIGHHLVARLKQEGHWVRGVDLKRPLWSESAADEFLVTDMRDPSLATRALEDAEIVFALAADMGGMGFISQNHGEILRHNCAINVNTARAADRCGVGSLFFSSSACVYPESFQMRAAVAPLRESDAWRDKPDTAYGVEKLFGEEVFLWHARERGARVRIARFHNIFGPEGSWNDGREKLPAAACRKVAIAKMKGDPRVEVWGDGLATRSFCYIDDCLDLLLRLMSSDHAEPINIGSDRLVTVNEMYRLAGRAAGLEIELVHVDGPQGVRGRNADLTIMEKVLGARPRVTLEEGMARTYRWIEARARENRDLLIR